MGFTRLGNHLTQGHLNNAFDALEMQTVWQHGRGVLFGCHLSAAGDCLRVRCNEGIVCAETARHVAWEHDIPVPANSTVFVWRSEDGKTLVTDSDSPVGGLFVCVGRVITNETGIVLCDGSGRMEPARMDPDDSRSFVVRAQILPKGPMHNPVSERFIDEDLFLEPSDRNIQIIDGGLQPLRVFVFDSPHYGNWLRIANNGAASIRVCHGDTDLITLYPGELVDLAVKPPFNTTFVKGDAYERRQQKAKRMDRNEWFVVLATNPANIAV